MVEMQAVEKHLHSNYLKKAGEYLSGMKDELVKRRWNMAALAGIHCAISACDALTIFFLGKKHKDKTRRCCQAVSWCGGTRYERIEREIQSIHLHSGLQNSGGVRQNPLQGAGCP